jgi:E3 ubiquitin-protein ligase UBR4
MIHLLEIALVDGMNMVVDILQPTTASALMDLLPMVDDCCGDYVDEYKKCRLEGIMLITNNYPTVVLPWFSC